jgi:paraquat-inducible protein B
MSESQHNSETAAELPAAKVTRRRWRFPLVWTIPVVAAAVAGYLVYDRFHEFGPQITIKFRDGGGLRIGQTPIKYRGVPIGEVTAVELSKDHHHVLVKVRLQRSAATLAQEGSLFWIVRPEVGIGNITGLGTVISGPEIQVLPGTGAAKSEFVGLDNAPVALESKGLKIVLRASRLGSVRTGSPVYYRGIEVGVVQKISLSGNATGVDIHVLIKERYAKLVRGNSVFWNVSGMDVSAGLFRGVEIKMESLRSVVAGGIAMATPNDSSARPIKQGTIFPLHETARPEWLEWAPEIAIVPEK